MGLNMRYYSSIRMGKYYKKTADLLKPEVMNDCF
mgnify:CR=1 FL=1